MPDDPDRHRRRSIRLRRHDYAAPRAYFVTVCIHGRRCLLGAVRGGVLLPSGAGAMVQAHWRALPERFPALAIDPAFVAMPNHFHGVAALAAPGDAAGPTLGAIIGAFTSLTTVAYARGVADLGWPLFEQRLWQRNYYEHIVRDEADLARIRAYIEANPGRWDEDWLHAAS